VLVKNYLGRRQASLCDVRERAKSHKNETTGKIVEETTAENKKFVVFVVNDKRLCAKEVNRKTGRKSYHLDESFLAIVIKS
jgi:hypothetical protein